jgi:hypothetical protein
MAEFGGFRNGGRILAVSFIRREHRPGAMRAFNCTAPPPEAEAAVLDAGDANFGRR